MSTRDSIELSGESLGEIAMKLRALMSMSGITGYYKGLLMNSTIEQVLDCGENASLWGDHVPLVDARVHEDPAYLSIGIASLKIIHHDEKEFYRRYSQGDVFHWITDKKGRQFLVIELASHQSRVVPTTFWHADNTGKKLPPLARYIFVQDP